ncbi:MAG TPA: TldD/PmbA family protein, partial [Acidimicrobiales bacterium]|nr:TldD/PmbA family protein [Acidimicrobiales bacterium]
HMIDQDVLERVLGRALRDGGDFAEVFAEDRVASSAMLDDGRIEELSSGRERGAGIRVVTGESTGFAHTTDLTEAGLLEAAAVASAAARGANAGVRTVALDRRAVTPAPIDIRPESISKAQKVELLRRAEAAAKAAGNDIRQVMAGYGDNRRRFVVANSDGIFAEDDQTRTRLVVQTVALGDTGMQTGFEAVAGARGWEIFDERSPEEVAEEAARRALLKLNARPAPSGTLPVVIAAGSGGVLFHEACGHGLEADLVGKGASTFAGRVGEQVASPLVTLIDDGTVAGAWGHLGVDDEGHPASRNVLIQDGMLADYMWDGLRARKEKRGQSGNGRRQTYKVLPMVRMTNTYLLNGESDPDDIIASTERGVFVKKLGGGQVDTASGDFVFGMVESYLIEDGEITDPLRESNLIGNGPDVLRGIDAVANDFAFADGGGMCGKDGQSVPVGMGQPTLRVAALTVGGTAS